MNGGGVLTMATADAALINRRREFWSFFLLVYNGLIDAYELEGGERPPADDGGINTAWPQIIRYLSDFCGWLATY